MAYPRVSGSSSRVWPSKQVTCSQLNFAAGQNVKVQAILNDGTVVDIAQLDVVQADIDALPARHKLRAMVKVSMVAVNS